MNVVLGGGISGLIWAYYHPDHFIVTDQVGGQMMSYFDLGPRYLHNKSEAVFKFLKDLNVPIKLSAIKVGYFDDKGWVEDPNLDFRHKYYLKSRGQKTLEGFDPTVLNTNLKEFQVCNVDFKDLIFKLYDVLSSRIYTGSVTKIDLKEQLIMTDTNMVLRYSKLVSTIPLNIFARLAGLSITLDSVDMAYCLLKESFFDIKDFDYVYVVISDANFHRITRCKQGVVCDVLGKNIDEFKKQIPIEYFTLLLDQSIKLVKNSQIISLDKDFELEDTSIKFVGRYGSWHRRWKTETVIEEAQKNA